MFMLVFWAAIPCGLVGRYQQFGQTSALNMETVCFSELLVSTYKSTWHYNPEEKQ
jgi:hypothetical protein